MVNKLRRRKRLKISVSGLSTYLSCPARYFFNYYSGVSKHTDFPRLCGIRIHNFIRRLEVGKRSNPRRFYYTDLEVAIKAWRYDWYTSVEKLTQTGLLLHPNQTDMHRYAKVGELCIRNYWDTNFNLQPPLEVEKKYEFLWPGTSVPLVGITDQIRSVRLDYIRAKRPELIINGELHPSFAPVMILDLKTDWASYDLLERKPEASLEEQMREQYALHFNIQATAYSWLYFKHTGKWPVGFWWNHLRTGLVYFTHRDNYPQDSEDLGKKFLLELGAMIEHLLDSENAQSFPKQVTRDNCRSCDFILPCLGTNYFRIAAAEKIHGEAVDPETVALFVNKPANKQMRMKLKVGRAKKEPLLSASSAKPEVTIHRDLPWREQELEWEETT